MSQYNQDYDDYCYDDGNFSDNGGNEEYDDFDIPTYDELDLEGRYYTYGSRQDYNKWRYQEIQALQAASQAASLPQSKYVHQKNRRTNIPTRHKSDELYTSDISTYQELTQEEKERWASRKEYNDWRNDFIKKRRQQRIRQREDKESFSNIIQWVSIILCISIFLIVIFCK